jgi:hypothetical protein
MRQMIIPALVFIAGIYTLICYYRFLANYEEKRKEKRRAKGYDE